MFQTVQQLFEQLQGMPSIYKVLLKKASQVWMRKKTKKNPEKMEFRNVSDAEKK